MTHEYTYKIVLFGDSAVGKTSFMNKYIHNEKIKNYLPTIGVDFGTKIVKSPNNKTIKINIWDTSGNKNFKNIVRSYFGGVAGAVLLYDKSNQTSFHNLHNWINDFDKINKHNDIPIMVIGTKTDLASAVTDEQIEYFKNHYKILYNEVDLNTNTDISNILSPLWDKIWHHFIIPNKICLGIKCHVPPPLPPPSYVRPYSAKKSLLTKKNVKSNFCIIS